MPCRDTLFSFICITGLQITQKVVLFVYMQNMLGTLIFVGLILWGCLIYARTHPSFSLPINTAAQKERCAQFGYDVEGDHTRSYADRLKEVVSGCW